MTTPIAADDIGSGVDAGAQAETEFSFANLTQVLAAWFSTVDWAADHGPDMPTSGPWPFLLYTQIPGGTDNRVTARGLVSVAVFDPDMGTAITLGRKMHARVLALRNQVVTVGGWQVPIGEIRTLELPGWSNYSDDPELHRVLGNYEIRSDFDAQPL